MKIKPYLDYQVILANQARPVCFAVSFDAPSIANPRPHPAAFCIVLDRSGSMAGVPLARAKEAAKLAVRNLREEDEFGLVVFDDTANVVVPLQRVGQKEAILKRIDEIASGGSTNLTAGWSLGRDELRKASAGSSRRLLLLSDGQLNVGIVEPSAVARIVAGGLEMLQVRTSCLGFGEGYNEDLMTTLAQATGGQFYDATSAEKFAPIFESELDGLQKLAVQNLRLRVRRLDFCEAFEAFSNYPAVELPDGAVEFAVGDLVSGENRVLCFELRVLPLPWLEGQPVASLQGEKLLEVEALWDAISEEGINSSSFAQTIRIQATQDPAEVRQQTELLPWVAMQKAGKIMDEVTSRMDKGDIQGATSLLSSNIDGLKNYAPPGAVAEAVQHLEQLRELVDDGEYSIMERKRSKYRSHSFRKMSSHEFWAAEGPKPSFKQQPPPHPPPPTPEPGGDKDGGSGSPGSAP